MRKITYFCDRCGKQVEGGLVQIGFRTIDLETGEPAEYEFGAELCFDCFKLVDDLIADAIKQKEAPKPKKVNRPAKSNIDMPKVFALQKAGWSLEKIGDEFGVSGQTISNHIRAWNERKEDGDAEVD